MKKKLVLMMSMLLWLGMFSACSSDDDTPSTLKFNKTDYSRTIENEIIDGLSFYLFHEDGGESLTFKTGEPLVFQLAFETSGNPILSQDLKEGDLTADQDLFAIYRENGEKVGLPQRERIDLTAFETALGPYVYRYIWSSSNGDALLEPGNYYTQFSIMYNANIGQSGKQMKKKDFKVYFKIE